MIYHNENNGAWVVWTGWNLRSSVNPVLWSSGQPQMALHYQIVYRRTVYLGPTEEDIYLIAVTGTAHLWNQIWPAWAASCPDLY